MFASTTFTNTWMGALSSAVGLIKAIKTHSLVPQYLFSLFGVRWFFSTKVGILTGLRLFAVNAGRQAGAVH